MVFRNFSVKLFEVFLQFLVISPKLVLKISQTFHENVVKVCIQSFPYFFKSFVKFLRSFYPISLKLFLKHFLQFVSHFQLFQFFSDNVSVVWPGIITNFSFSHFRVVFTKFHRSISITSIISKYAKISSKICAIFLGSFPENLSENYQKSWVFSSKFLHYTEIILYKFVMNLMKR